MIISMINQEQNIIFKYHLNRIDYSQSQMIKLVTQVGYYKHGKQEKKI